MAPADDAGKKKRENQYFDVGVQGRKTGVTLEDRGVRDEHGMELIDGIFSSPEKSPAKRTARSDDRTLTSSDMDVQQSSMPEPAETLSARRSLQTSGKTSLPPPLGRSPIKTNLGSSPRRQSSMGPPSQPRPNAQLSGRAASHPAVARRLDFSNTGKGQDVEESPAQSGGSSGRAVRRKHLDEIEESPVQQTRRTMDESIVEVEDAEEGAEEEAEDEALADEDANGQMNGAPEDSPEPVNGDDSVEMLPEQGEAEDEEEPISELIPPPKKGSKARKGRSSIDESTDQIQDLADEIPAAQPKKRGRPKGSSLLVSQSNHAPRARNNRTGRIAQKATDANQADESAEDVEAPEEDPSVLEESAAAPKKRGRKPKAKPTQAVEDESTVDDPPVLEEPAAAPKKRGRKPKAKPAEAMEDTTMVEGPAQEAPKRGRPAKKREHVEVEEDAQGEPGPPNKRAKQKGPQKKPPSERDPNAKVVSKAIGAKSKKGQAQAREPSVAAAATHANRQRTREETPYQDPKAVKTRGGRVVMRPLDYFKGERAEYDHDRNMLRVIHIDEDPPEKKTRQRKASGRPRRRAPAVIEEEEPELEEWEQDGDMVISGLMNGWDEINNVPMPAWKTEKGIEMRMDDVKSGEFRYSKILTSPFFSAGMVDLPAQGSKSLKNSKNKHMSFCLLSGKVEVQVGEMLFAISKGGVFIVPRGNIYAIHNVAEEPARIFFTWACEVAPGTTEPQTAQQALSREEEQEE
ncbi:hypothetical protein K490DRAFT_58421 [Saccharata proteae CBS 121410]|uniref:CENP-C homolog n=1 Tax=Saccharata proteae CBS 121410 TaxID=1314787 RepID=A0A9P4HQ30_9PEZI|nr:hypothetical protein K490DRAFT_58421 [Saccharata proteae CBS 121410]